jgi:hypothetical protein
MSRTPVLLALDEDIARFIYDLNHVDPSSMVNTLLRREKNRRGEVGQLLEEHLLETIPAAG